MSKHLLVIFGILFFLNSCKQVESKKENDLEAKEITKKVEEKEELTDLNSVADSFIANDSLTAVLKSELDKIASNSKFKIEKKPIKNRHVDNLMDTIVTRIFKDTKLTSYKATSEEWIFNAKIENAEFELLDFIKIGTKKYVVEKSLAKGIPSDTLTIGNIEQTSKFILKFQSGVLKTIEYEGYTD